jgi:hypothetical protein
LMDTNKIWKVCTIHFSMTLQTSYHQLGPLIYFHVHPLKKKEISSSDPFTHTDTQSRRRGGIYSEISIHNCHTNHFPAFIIKSSCSWKTHTKTMYTYIGHVISLTVTVLQQSFRLLGQELQYDWNVLFLSMGQKCNISFWNVTKWQATDTSHYLCNCNGHYETLPCLSQARNAVGAVGVRGWC